MSSRGGETPTDVTETEPGRPHVVGGGFGGIESAGALAELYRRNLARDYPAIVQDRRRARA